MEGAQSAPPPTAQTDSATPSTHPPSGSTQTPFEPRVVAGLLKAGYKQDEGARAHKLAKFGYQYDPSLSSHKTTVARHTETGKVAVIYKGTDPTNIHDVWTDLHVLAGTRAGKLSRVKEAKKVYKSASLKYGKDNVTAMGHSLGGYLAQHVGADQVVTFNKLSVGDERRTAGSHQIDYRNRGDVASMMRDTKGMKGPNQQTIEVAGGKWYKPIATHTQFRHLKVAEQTGRRRNLRDVGESVATTAFRVARGGLQAARKSVNTTKKVFIKDTKQAVKRVAKGVVGRIFGVK